jgi:hypothetical protein
MNGQKKLSNDFLEIARKELGESEKTKQEALQQLRAWIKNQPNIKEFNRGM